MNSVTQVSYAVNRQVRPNLWITTQGAVVGYGPCLAPNGFVYCFTCSTDECQHVQQLDEDWLKGQDSVETTGRWCTACQFGQHCGSCVCCNSEAIPFMGEPVVYDDSECYDQEAEYGIPPLW